jgi:hypothetical protein
MNPLRDTKDETPGQAPVIVILPASIEAEDGRILESLINARPSETARSGGQRC